MSLESIASESSLLSIMLRFTVNLLVLIILIRFIYYRFTKKEEYVFSLFMMGIIIFLLSSLLGTVNIQLGMALGLFAIFAILRFRTVNYTAKDMTYVFTVIGVSIINSQANIPPPVIGAVTVNTIILTSAVILELFLKKRALSQVLVSFNKPELLLPEKREQLLEELSARTGQQIIKFSIRKIDVIRNSVDLEAYYLDKATD
jgi:hypothetical protein